MNRPSILIVENEAIVAADLANKLRQLGYGISGTIWRGEDAVALAREVKPALVLMDIRLAGQMDGIEAAELLRTQCGLPVVYLTAYSDRETLQRAKLSEPFGYILKPFSERELETHIEIALYKHHTEQKLRASEERLRQLNTELEQRVLERTAQLRELNVELTLAEERERTRIAQMLHDHLQPPLMAARMHMEAGNNCLNHKSRREHFRKASELFNQAATISSELQQELCPSVLADFGLAEALRSLGTWMRDKHGLDVNLETYAGDATLPHTSKVLLYHSVRELLFNIVKDSAVKGASVRLVRNGDEKIAVLVSEQPAGLDARWISRHLAGDELCLFGIRERLVQRGGHMEVEPNPDFGSQVRLTAP